MFQVHRKYLIKYFVIEMLDFMKNYRIIVTHVEERNCYNLESNPGPF